MSKSVAIVVMGVSGAGKSTVARAIAGKIECAFTEGDDLHPPSNIEKMSLGIPLTDEDRRPWLEHIGEKVAAIVATGNSTVVSCSALKQRYRDLLRGLVGDKLIFVHLHGTREVLLSRLDQREDHFMPSALLDSQLASLEAPLREDDALIFDIATSPDDIASAVVKRVFPMEEQGFVRATSGSTENKESLVNRPRLLMMCEFPSWDMDALRRDYEILLMPEEPQKDRFLAENGQGVRAVATAGSIGITADIMARLPELGIVACYGVGTDAIDLRYARSRKILVTNTPDVLNDDVADLAFGLLIDSARRMSFADAFVRSGGWSRVGMPLTVRVSGKKLGVVGMGRIGQAIARRAEGFGLRIGYHTRTSNSQLPFAYFQDLEDMARWCDFLIVIVPGGDSTKGLINAAVIEALGSDGILVNVSRGSVVDEAALLDALENGRLRAAGLDVFASEPLIDGRFSALENVVLQPHHGSGTIESRKAMGQLMRDNLAAFFGGETLPTPVA